MEADLIELEDLLDQLRKRQKALRYDYEKIRKMPKPEQIDDREIELVYNQFKSELGNAVVKSLNEVVGFKNKIEEFQRTLVNQKAKELESQLKSIAEQIRVLDDEYSEKLKVIDKKGVLKNLKVSLKIYEAKKDSISHTKFLFDQYEKNEKKKRMLNLQKTQQLLFFYGFIIFPDLCFVSHSALFGYFQTLPGIYSSRKPPKSWKSTCL